MIGSTSRILIGLLVNLAFAGACLSADDELLVLTALPPVYSLTSSLAADTRIRVENLPEQGRRLSGLADLLERRGDSFAEQFARADAVITIGKLWRDDPLFTAAREHNIRIVDIDATKPWSTTLEGVTVALEPDPNAPWDEAGVGERTPSVYFWLAPANGARMADIIARDLARLSPGDAPTIERNLAAVSRELLDLKLEYELRFAALADVTVFALASEFVYLTSDMGLFVDGYFVKQDIDWTADDLGAFTGYLSERDIGVVIHKWEPEASIRAAIDAAGARLAVLDVIDAGLVVDGRLDPDSYLTLLRANLDALAAALETAND